MRSPNARSQGRSAGGRGGPGGAPAAAALLRALLGSTLLCLLLGACTSGAAPTSAPVQASSSAAAPPSAPAQDPHAAGHDAAGPGTPSAAGPTAAPAPDAATTAGAAPSAYDALRQRMSAILAAQGSDAALAALQRTVTRDPGLAGYCHAVAHDLGHAALTAAHGEPSEAMDARNDVCGGGFIHGVVEAALAESDHPKRDLLRICAPANDGTCWHGVGHGVMFATAFDVPNAEALCRRAPTARLVGRCAEGLYMQLFIKDEGGGGPHVAGKDFVEPTSSNAAGICRKAAQPFASACWFYAPTLVLQEHPEAWRKALAWCGTQTAGRSDCTTGVGSRLIKHHPDDVPFAARMCRSAPAGELGSCLRGMGSYWRVHWHGTKSRVSVCDRLKASDLVRQCRAVNA